MMRVQILAGDPGLGRLVGEVLGSAGATVIPEAAVVGREPPHADHLDVLRVAPPDVSTGRYCVLVVTADQLKPEAVAGPLAEAAGDNVIALAVPAAPGSARDGRDGGPQRLSQREREVLDCIAGGLTHSQTAARMRVSVHTVNTYVKRLKAKLGHGNKAFLTRAALNSDDAASPAS